MARMRLGSHVHCPHVASNTWKMLIIISILRNYREVKSWSVQSTCKLPSQPKVRVANTCSGMALFILVLRMLFFFTPGRMYHISARRKTENVTFSASVWGPRLRLGCQFTRAVDCPSFFLPRCVIYYFSPYPSRKYHICVFEPGAKVAPSVRVWWKIVYATRGLRGSLLSLANSLSP